MSRESMTDNEYVDDGFGNVWVTCGLLCDLHVVRPGKVQCSCDGMGMPLHVIEDNPRDDGEL